MLRECNFYTRAGDLPGLEEYELMAMRDDHERMASGRVIRGENIGVPLQE